MADKKKAGAGEKKDDGGLAEALRQCDFLKEMLAQRASQVIQAETLAAASTERAKNAVLETEAALARQESINAEARRGLEHRVQALIADKAVLEAEILRLQHALSDQESTTQDMREVHAEAIAAMTADYKALRSAYEDRADEFASMLAGLLQQQESIQLVEVGGGQQADIKRAMELYCDITK
jgi:hypothetical protein